MNEGTEMTDGAGASEAAGMDAQGAAAIMRAGAGAGPA